MQKASDEFACPALKRRDFQSAGFLVKLPASEVDVAQLVEQWIVVPLVAGSNPVVHPIFAPPLPHLIRGARKPTDTSSRLDLTREA